MSPQKPPSSNVNDKRRRILDAAYEVCERLGVEGAHMDEVAALAGVSKGTLYTTSRASRISSLPR